MTCLRVSRVSIRNRHKGKKANCRVLYLEHGDAINAVFAKISFKGDFSPFCILDDIFIENIIKT